MRSLHRLLLLILATLILCACNTDPRGQPQASLAPTPIPLPSATARPTSTPRPSATSTPTETPAPPTPTFLPLDPTATLAPLSSEERLAIFDKAWEVVHDNYLYEDFNGVDWAAVRAEFEPLVAAENDPATFYALMRELIARLGDDHSRFESPQEVAEQEARFEGISRYAGIGAIVRLIDEGILILELAPDGPAARAGLQPRDLIVAINGIPANDREAFGPDGPISVVRGIPGSSVRLLIQTPSQRAREVELTRAVIDEDIFNEVSAQRIANGRIGLIKIPSFYVSEVDTKVRAAVEQMLTEDPPLSGLVLDIRSNSGGFVHLMRNTIALFHNGGTIGSTSGRHSSEEQNIPTGKTIPGTKNLPIIVLTGPDTISAAEMFAAGMQVLGRARIVGMPSAGNTENLFSYSFDDGSRILMAQVAYKLPDGTLIEGRGVIPDRQVDAEWWRYPTESDPQIIAAIEEIQLAAK